MSEPRRAARRAFVALIAVLLLSGLVRRLARLDAGLWIDEAGTLWCVEGDLAQCVARTLEVQGQSPLAYVPAWASIHALGESAWALRLPSLLAGCAAALLLVPVGRAAGRPQAGWIGAALLLTSTAASTHGTEARPTALAAAFTALLLLGFLRAARGERGGRALFVAGGLGLFYAHYVLVLPAAGLALAWALRPDLRARWPARAFLLDVGVQVALAVPGLVDLRRSVRPGWAWQDDALPGVAVLVLGPAALVVVAAWQLLRPRERPLVGEPTLRSAALALGLAACAPVAVALVLAPLGVNLLILRYLSNVAVPAAALVGLALWVTAEAGFPRHARRLALAYLLVTGPLGVGAPPITAGEGWREAVASVTAGQTEPPAPVLYRSGFVEDDERALFPGEAHEPSPFTLAPLRAPGAPAPSWPIVPLTCTWEVAGRREHLEARVSPVLASATRAYVIAHASRGYLPLLAAWVEERFPRRFTLTLVDDGRRGVFVLRLDLRR